MICKGKLLVGASRKTFNRQYFSIVYTYIEVLTLRNSDEQKSVFVAKNRPNITASIFGKLLLFALINAGSMAVYASIMRYGWK